MAKKAKFTGVREEIRAAEPLNVKSKMQDDGNRNCNICLMPVDQCRHKINYGIADNTVVEITPIEAIEYKDDISYTNEVEAVALDTTDDID